MPHQRRWLTILIIALICAPVVGIAAYRARGYKTSTSDFDSFYQTVRYGLYSDKPATMQTEWGVFNYHPFFMVVMAPLGLLPMWAACGVFVAISILLFGFSVHVVIRRLAPTCQRLRRRIAIGSTLLVSPFLVNSLLLGQFECLLVFLLVMGWKLIEDRRDLAAGLCISAAAMLKAYPAILLVWLLFKRKYRALMGALAGVVLGAGILPSLLFGPEENVRLHQEWFERAVIGNSALRELVKTEHGMWWYNIEAMPITLRRYLTPQTYSSRAPQATINFVTLPDEPVTVGPVTLVWLQWIYVLIAGGVSLATCWLIRHPARRISTARQRFEYAMMILVGLILSPIVWAARYLLLAWFGLCLLCHERASVPERQGSRRFATMVLIVWTATLAMWTEWLRAYSVHFWAMVLLACWLGARAAQSGRTTPRAPAPTC